MPQDILSALEAEMEDFITVVRIPMTLPGTRPRYRVELRRSDSRTDGAGEFHVTQVSEPLGKVEAGKLAKVWGKFHRLEVR